MTENEPALFLSAVVLAEVQQGIAFLRRRNEPGDVRRADALSEWLRDRILVFGPRILALDTAVAIAAGNMSDRARAEGIHPGFPDIAIAATAEVHGLIVLTRNLKHFAKLGPTARDPFAES